jgi:hypothetical protein
MALFVVHNGAHHAHLVAMLAPEVADEYLDRMRRALDAAMYYREVDVDGLAGGALDDDDGAE